MRQSTQLLEHIQDMCVSLSNEEYNTGSFILDVLAEAMTNLRDALQLLLGIAACGLYRSLKRWGVKDFRCMNFIKKTRKSLVRTA